MVQQCVPAWKGLPVYVGCSGNFTVERILSKAGLREIHSNDVSLYSCALGRYLSFDAPPTWRLVPDDLQWLAPYLTEPRDSIATLMLLLPMMEYYGGKTPHHQRMLRHFSIKFPDLHHETVERVKRALDGLSLESFHAGDVVDWMAQVPEGAVAISFPPTYKAAYEHLYARLMKVVEWQDAPAYTLFDDDRLKLLLDAITSKRHWMIARDCPLPSFKAHYCARLQTGLRSKPLYVYADMASARCHGPHQLIAQLGAARLLPHQRITAESRLLVQVITQGQMNLLRSEYLSATIAPSPAWLNLAVTIDGHVAGGLGFAREKFGSDSGVYLLTDFAVTSSHRRLSKLILASALSIEVQELLKQRFVSRALTLTTTAFTKKAESMKYRGLFQISSRNDGLVNYVAPAGRWTLAEGLKWWLEHHSLSLHV